MFYDEQTTTARYNLGAEQSVLGAMLLDSTDDKIYYQKVVNTLSAGDFYFAGHSWLFRAIVERVESGEPAEPVWTRGDIDEGLADFGGKNYIADLIATVPSVANAGSYAKTVRDHSIARQYAELGQRLQVEASDKAIKIEDLVERAREGIKTLEESAKGKTDPLWPPEQASIAAWLDKKPPSREYIIPDFLPKDIVAILAAEGGTGKSYAVIQMAIAVALGLPLFGLYQPGPPTGVLMVFAEESEEELWRRVYYLFQFMCGQYDDVDRLRDMLVKNLHMKSMIGEDCLMTTMDGTACKRTALPAKLVAAAKNYEGLGLLVLDPIANLNGGEENDNNHANIFVQTLAWIGIKLGGVTVFAVHHTNKASSADTGMSQNAIRGGSGFVNAARLAILMRKVEEKQCKKYGIPSGCHTDFRLWGVVKGNYSPSGMEYLLHQNQSGAFHYQETKQQEESGELSDSAIIHRVCSIIREQNAMGKFYTKTLFVNTFSRVIGVPGGRLTKLVNDAVSDGVLGLLEPPVKMQNVRQVLVVVNGGF